MIHVETIPASYTRARYPLTLLRYGRKVTGICVRVPGRRSLLLWVERW